MQRLALLVVFSFVAKACVISYEENTNGLPFSVKDSISPGDDFYSYVNHNWIQQQPGEKTSSMQLELVRMVKYRLTTVLKNRLDNPEDPVSIYFNAFSDWGARDSLSVESIQEELQFIFYKQNSLGEIIALMETRGYRTPISTSYVYRDGRSLPVIAADRYPDDPAWNYIARRIIELSTSHRIDSLLSKYDSAFSMLPSNTRADHSNKVSSLVKDLERFRGENVWQIVQDSTPDFDSKIGQDIIKDYMGEIHPVIPKRFGIAYADVWDDFSIMFNSYSEEEWEYFLKYVAIMENFYYADMGSFEYLLGDVLETEARHIAIERLFNLSLAKDYWDEYLPLELEGIIEEMFTGILNAYKTDIQNSTVVDDESKETLLSRLEDMNLIIALPQDSLVFQSIDLNPTNLIQMTRALEEVNYRRWQESSITHPRTIYASPFEFNTMIDKSKNSVYLAFPFLTDPMVAMDRDMSLNYGGLGFYLGHEIGHSLGDMDSTFFTIRSYWQMLRNMQLNLVDQYDSYHVADLGTVDGEKTLYENMADIMGMNMTVYAFTKSPYYDSTIFIDGFNQLQLLFLNKAHTERRRSPDKEISKSLINDVHTYANPRVNGMLRNIDAFHEAFSITENDSLFLHPEERFRMW